MTLSDSQILSIFRSVANSAVLEKESLHHYALAVLLADKEDFRILRPTSLVLIGKHKLGEYLEKGSTEMVEHNFPGRMA